MREYAERKMAAAAKKNRVYYCPICGEPVKPSDQWEYIQNRRKEDLFYHERCLKIYFCPRSARRH